MYDSRGLALGLGKNDVDEVRRCWHDRDRLEIISRHNQRDRSRDKRCRSMRLPGTRLMLTIAAKPTEKLNQQATPDLHTKSRSAAFATTSCCDQSTCNRPGYNLFTQRSTRYRHYMSVQGRHPACCKPRHVDSVHPQAYRSANQLHSNFKGIRGQQAFHEVWQC